MFVNGKELEVDGAILIWGEATEQGRDAVINVYKFHEVLTMVEIINELQLWKNSEYRQFVENRRCWSNELFDALI